MSSENDSDDGNNWSKLNTITTFDRKNLIADNLLSNVLPLLLMKAIL